MPSQPTELIPTPVRVRVREDGDLFYRRAAHLLSMSHSHVAFGRHNLPLNALTICPGLGIQDIVLTTPTTAFCLRPAHKSDPAWPVLKKMLRLAILSPPGYRYVDHIGSGSFGVVYKAHSTQPPSNHLYAIKHISRSLLTRQNVPLQVARRELRIVTALPHHQNVVRTHAAFETANSMFIVMEFVPGGTLLDLARRTPQSFHSIRAILKQLLTALSHLHSNQVIHRDFKMENILIKPAQPHPVVKLCDFGLSVSHDPQNPLPHFTSVGTRYAHAPEMVLAAEQGVKRAHYGTAVDVWACGIALFSLLYNRIPWLDSPQQQRQDMRAMRKLSSHSKPSIQLIQTVEERLNTPPLLHSLLCGLLQPSPEKRLTARAALEHRLFDHHNNKHLDARREIEQDLMQSPVSVKQLFRRVVSLVRAVELLRNSGNSGYPQGMFVL
ncbi:Calcium-dependent protein kinase 29 [Gracilariopsis chorda]|uniref:Calcium-dependent protein kinase 29 n=1 Tax=Gracilariopsis chorda TaxID=448386 RepID=A0A2V3J4U5_9FLOR|nr:Calcium-dependent protein kinase 29 [Gracilariopsis chorda]|eukprot:PXF49142.1 Calcium-dependent protein kinase 29 [Gracilariopsis chorda]